jgi:hypothetical protein
LVADDEIKSVLAGPFFAQDTADDAAADADAALPHGYAAVAKQEIIVEV